MLVAVRSAAWNRRIFLQPASLPGTNKPRVSELKQDHLVGNASTSLFARISKHMSDRGFHLQLKFTPKSGHTFTDEREVIVEVPKELVKRTLELINDWAYLCYALWRDPLPLTIQRISRSHSCVCKKVYARPEI
jgi:hypothetical protein